MMLRIVVDTFLELIGWVLNGFGFPDFQNYLKSRPSKVLRFHRCSGLVSLHKKGSIASRLDRNNFKDGIAFSHRPINADETVSVVVLKTTRKWVGPLAIGFTCFDPSSLQAADLRRIKANSHHPLGGFWIKSLLTHEMEPGQRISFSYSVTGTMRYSVNGVEQDDVLTGLLVRRPLWAVFDVYGTVQSIKLVRSKSGEINHTILENYREQFDLIPHSVMVMPNPMFPFSEQNSELPSTWMSSIFYSNFSDSPIHRRDSRAVPEPMPLYRRRRGIFEPEMSLICSNGRPSLEAFQTPSETFNSVKCVICLENGTTMTVMNCGHLCLCVQCAMSFEQKSPRTFDFNGTPRLACPVCRRPIYNILN